MKITLLVTLLCLFGSLEAQRISYVPHKSLTPIYSKLRSPYWQYVTYQPALRVAGGCVPFPGVNSYKASAGLRIGGSPSGDCSKSTGQVYARHKDYRNAVTGIMYAYYFPKDQGVHGGGSWGHRHDWEEIVVWVDKSDSDWRNWRALGASLSGHGSYKKATSGWSDCRYPLDYGRGCHKRAVYARPWYKFSNREMLNTNRNTYYYWKHPMAAYDLMSTGEQYALNHARWMHTDGKEYATPKIRDADFDNKMGQACRKFFGSRSSIC